MTTNADKKIDWQKQAIGLAAKASRPDPIAAHETWFGYCAAGQGERGTREVHWLEKSDKGAPCVAEPCVGVLRRYVEQGHEDDGRPPVLILPGATAWRGTFFQPEQPESGLIGRLARRKFDVWTLDWRGTKVITDLWRGCTREKVPVEIEGMTLDAIANEEVPAAVRKIAERAKGQADIAILGHCVGSAVAALAIARGALGGCARGGASSQPSAILSTIGLFYRGAVDTWLRANERLDESIAGIALPEPWYIDFAVDIGEPPAWPDFYEKFYGLWTKTPYPHCELSFCRRISSIIGAPYRPDDIAYLHDDEHNGLAEQFGVLPLALLDDIGRAVRRGYADAQLVANGGQAEARRHFGEFAVTLLTGSENQLWHRDSIDRMHEWLLRSSKIEVEKRIFDRYGHQDLWWSPRAAERDGVYDYVERRLRGASPR